MFCCVLKSSDCHIIYSTYIPRKYLVWEVWEAFNFPCRLWRWDRMARGEMIGQKNTGLLLQWISQESWHSFLNWLKIRKNSGIFVQLWGGRKRNFLVSKGGYSTPCGSVLNGSVLDRAQIKVPHLKILQGWSQTRVFLMIVWYVPCPNQHFCNRQVLSERFNCSVILVWPHPLTPLEIFTGIYGIPSQSALLRLTRT